MNDVLFGIILLIAIVMGATMGMLVWNGKNIIGIGAQDLNSSILFAPTDTDVTPISGQLNTIRDNTEKVVNASDIMIVILAMGTYLAILFSVVYLGASPLLIFAVLLTNIFCFFGWSIVVNAIDTFFGVFPGLVSRFPTTIWYFSNGNVILSIMLVVLDVAAFLGIRRNQQ